MSHRANARHNVIVRMADTARTFAPGRDLSVRLFFGLPFLAAQAEPAVQFSVDGSRWVISGNSVNGSRRSICGCAQ